MKVPSTIYYDPSLTHIHILKYIIIFIFDVQHFDVQHRTYQTLEYAYTHYNERTEKSKKQKPFIHSSTTIIKIWRNLIIIIRDNM